MPNGNSEAAADTAFLQRVATLLPWRPIYKGIDHAVGGSLQAFGSRVPRLQRVTAMRVDLQGEGIDFRTTESAGTENGETIGDVITSFVERYSVAIAINANFSWTEEGSKFPIGAYYELLGLAMNQGRIVCDPRRKGWGPTDSSPDADVPDGTYAGCTALMISGSSGNFSATIQLATLHDTFDPSGVWCAIAGSRNPGAGWAPQKPDGPQLQFLVENGIPQEPSGDTQVAARTAAGLSQDGRYLYLLVVEGREQTKGYGASFFDLANWMILAGAYTAVPLDGGGSSVMAKFDPETEKAVLLNIPYGDETTPGRQRSVGNFFGVIASPL